MSQCCNGVSGTKLPVEISTPQASFNSLPSILGIDIHS